MAFDQIHTPYYYLAPPVSCEWNAWEIGDCSAPCGLGNRTKTRTKTENNESHRRKCEGQGETVESCKIKDCAGKLFILTIIDICVIL